MGSSSPGSTNSSTSAMVTRPHIAASGLKLPKRRAKASAMAEMPTSIHSMEFSNEPKTASIGPPSCARTCMQPP